MMNIKTEDVKALRTFTGAGMMDCKKALVEANGDFNKAIDILSNDKRCRIVCGKLPPITECSHCASCSTCTYTYNENDDACVECKDHMCLRRNNNK